VFNHFKQDAENMYCCQVTRKHF